MLRVNSKLDVKTSKMFLELKDRASNIKKGYNKKIPRFQGPNT